MEGIREGHRAGRPPHLSQHQRQELVDLLDSGPVAYGFTAGGWTCPMVGRVIQEECSVSYHPAHVSKLLHELEFSVQRPRKTLARATKALQSRWVRYRFPDVTKSQTRGSGCPLWGRGLLPPRPHPLSNLGQGRVSAGIPTTGQRNTRKIFGPIELYSARFLSQFQQVFNAQTSSEYLERILRHYVPRRIHLIQDNASSHKDGEVWAWFSDHRRYLEVHNLPPSSPQLNALERVGHHTRLHGTHNRYFPTQDDLRGTLTSTCRSIQHRPTQGQG